MLIKNYAVVGVHWGLYNLMNPGLVCATHDELVRLFEAALVLNPGDEVAVRFLEVLRLQVN